jgi:hypothetical protein
MKRKISKRSAAFSFSRGDLYIITPLAVSLQESAVFPPGFHRIKGFHRVVQKADRRVFFRHAPLRCSASGSVDRGFTGWMDPIAPVIYGKEVPSKIKDFYFAP